MRKKIVRKYKIKEIEAAKKDLKNQGQKIVKNKNAKKIFKNVKMKKKNAKRILKN